ncbi:cobalt ECF transporter T component CbiQ [Corynebacterium epidermidicanis]|uniref:Cobalt ABC transporter, permease protein CbiQ n=1 Tax=Corynebacterium epidermidicanis TaxID=1050174 RepID=A0A0G3GVM4_9CORY|nr:cobalt ECF transporter T component CbiQ [Corynebacterium epidermidicanis]AKK02912.1 cobalt ABC transporter, permease protein CbiQ [Corynebacterium epidermidicanis]
MNPLEIAAAASPWARVNVGQKAFLILGLLVLAVALPPLPTLPIVASVVALLAVFARVPWRLFGVLVTAPAAFVALGLGPLIFTLSPTGLQLIDGGPSHALNVLARCAVASAATILFALTTPIAEILGFASRRHVPETLVQLVALMYRLTSTLIVTARNLWHTQAARLGHSNWRRWLRSTADQAATLFVLSFSRARALEQGLELRADPNSMRTLTAVRPVEWKVVLATGALHALIIALVWWYS